MKKTIRKALLGALAVSSASTALVALDTKPALACNPYCNMPRTGFNIQSESVGRMTFSGAGTALFNQSEGQRNTVSAGTSSTLSYSTNLSTSPNYGGAASLSVDSLDSSVLQQGIGVAQQSTTGEGEAAIAGASFNGIFKAAMSTESGSNNTKSNVDITGIMAQTNINAEGASITLDTGIVNPEVATDNGTASASAVIASGTTADAAISGSTFASGFMQYFAPGVGFDTVSFSGGHDDVTVSDGEDTTAGAGGG